MARGSSLDFFFPSRRILGTRAGVGATQEVEFTKEFIKEPVGFTKESVKEDIGAGKSS